MGGGLQPDIMMIAKGIGGGFVFGRGFGDEDAAKRA